MEYRCRKCGKKLDEESFGLYCKECENTKKYNPNEALEADVREATKRHLSYGQYKGGKR